MKIYFEAFRCHGPDPQFVAIEIDPEMLCQEIARLQQIVIDHNLSQVQSDLTSNDDSSDDEPVPHEELVVSEFGFWFEGRTKFDHGTVLNTRHLNFNDFRDRLQAAPQDQPFYANGEWLRGVVEACEEAYNSPASVMNSPTAKPDRL